jgi:hypothetical protein
VNLAAAVCILGVSIDEVISLCQAGTLDATPTRGGFWLIRECSLFQRCDAVQNARGAVRVVKREAELTAVPSPAPPPKLAAPAGACEAHFSRRGRVVVAYKMSLCWRCFSGRALSVKKVE